MQFVTLNAVALLLMTLFTYLVSTLINEKFGQPRLLTIMINRSNIFGNFNFGIWVGWLLHFIIGLCFLWGYFSFNAFIHFKVDILNGFTYGILAGIIGVLGWFIMFNLHKNPPEVSRHIFYYQLVGAHIVFSITITYALNIFWEA